MDKLTKQKVRTKVDTYLKRAEEIKAMKNHKPTKMPCMANDAVGSGKSRNDKDSDEEKGDPDKRRMMQKFESQSNHIFVFNKNITILLLS